MSVTWSEVSGKEGELDTSSPTVFSTKDTKVGLAGCFFLNILWFLHKGLQNFVGAKSKANFQTEAIQSQENWVPFTEPIPIHLLKPYSKLSKFVKKFACFFKDLKLAHRVIVLTLIRLKTNKNTPKSII